MTIRAVVWDVDDTLFDYTGADRAAMREHLLAEGLADGPAGLTEALERWREATELHWARFSAGEVSFEGQRLDRVRLFLGRELTDTEAEDWFQRYKAHYETAWALFPDVLPALDALAATHRHAVLSNSSLTVQDRKLRTLGVYDRFEAVLCAAELGVSSPRPGPSSRPARRWNCRRTRWRMSEITPRSTGAVPRTPACCPCGSTVTADTLLVRSSWGGTGSPRSPNSPRSSAPIPVLEPRPPSGNVLPAPPESGPKGREPEAQTRTRSRRGLSFSGLWCNWQHDGFWFR